MKRKILLLISLILLPLNVLAASGTISASASSTKVTLNNTVTVTVKVSSTDTLGSWQYGLSYDKAKLSLVSGDTNIVGYGDGTYSSKTYTYKFKAIATGSAAITIDNPKIVDWNTDNYVTTSPSNLTLTIKEPVVVNYSSDNNLKSLSIDGFEINPVFNKSTLEYSVTVLATTEKVTVNASANDSKAKVSGTGEINVSEGNNSLAVVVTAENGTSKTYTINVVVPEKNPIVYKFNGENYSILRKLPENIPNNFNTNTIKFNNEEVPCLQNEKLNLTLLYLRDKTNKENFYIYNSSTKVVTLYNEIKNNDISIYIDNTDKKLANMIDTTIKINNQEVKAYQIKKDSKDYIIYGKNVSNGKSNYYVYDKDNKTISLFNEADFNYLLNSNNMYKTVTYALGVLILILLIIIILINKNKKKLVIMVDKLTSEIKDAKQEIIEKNKENKKKKDKE